MVTRRLELAKNGPRPDLFEGLARKAAELGLNMRDITQNSATLVVAGERSPRVPKSHSTRPFVLREAGLVEGRYTDDRSWYKEPKLCRQPSLVSPTSSRGTRSTWRQWWTKSAPLSRAPTRSH